MGYFLIVPEQNATGAGNTVSAEGIITSDFISDEAVQVSELPIVALYYPGAESIEASSSGDLELTYVAWREFYSVETTDNTPLELGSSGGGAIEVYDEVTQLTSSLTRLTFIGSDVIAQSGAGTGFVSVFVPPISFAPTMNLTVSGGPYNGAAIVEYGATIPGLSVAWATNDAVNFPITSYSALTLNGGAITLDGGASVATGGLYTAVLDVTSMGTGISVQLTSATFNATVTDNITFAWRYYHFKSPTASGITEAAIEAGSNVLATARAGSKAFALSGAPEYLWICYPQTWGNATTFVNPSNGFNVPFQAPEVVVVTNVEGAATNYLAYRSTNAMAGAITVNVS